MQQLQLPPLSEGETYIGAIGNTAGDAYHLVLLPGDNEPAPHVAQMDWAKSIGGDLPNKFESAMLFAHAKDQFQQTCYWNNETVVYPDESEDETYAWVQDFGDGIQSYLHKSHGFRARAVRRMVIGKGEA
jgi:hypothetical protein